jgi:CheY-like chemotaxis protein
MDFLPSCISKPIILCVDDSETQLWLRAKVLEQNGYTVLKATSAAKAFQLLRTNAVSLALSDHLLSDTNGLELARKIKTHSASHACCSLLGCAAANDDQCGLLHPEG